ncbi:phage holin family protein [Tenacibaculum sp. SSH1-16]|uniref:phage holin family protein n=1 Tax=Tenacibaculum sp. SSH1-16 TaxID=3136667 RepID=UPI0032C49B97|nr:hypothetical protein BACY1_08840 [Tenacibaculum mesophilum]
MKYQIDTTLKGIMQAISYALVCAYAWLHSKGIDTHAFTVLVVFMVLDMAFGAWKARRVKDLPNPSSDIAKKGIAVKAVMFSIPIVVGLMWSLFDKSNAVKVVNTLLIALAIAEGYSVIGNAGAIYSRKNITEYDAVTYVFKTISLIIKNMLEQFLNKLKNDASNSTK